MKTFSLKTLLVGTAVLAVFCAWLIHNIQVSLDNDNAIICQSNLKQVGMALRHYESAQQRFPIAIEKTSTGQLWRSWRSLLYPSFMEQLQPVYDVSTAWDSETNMRLINGRPILLGEKEAEQRMTTMKRVPWCFSCPTCKNPTGVSYVVITGNGTAFPYSGTTKLSDFTDGIENTLLLVESVTCTPEWTEPRDLDIQTMDFQINSYNKPSISSWHPKGAFVCFADLAVFCVTPRISESELKALITIAGGEKVSRADLVQRGILIQP